MEKPPIPETEAERYASLERLRILDTPAEERFDRITRLAQRLFQVPIALVSLVDTHRQWFKSAQGLSVSETPRDISFCGHAIVEERPLVVSDATTDARFDDNPLVTGEPRLRFYAGHPISAPDGHRIGTLCLIDRRPRELSKRDLQTLGDLAALVENELQVSRLSQAQVELQAKLSAAERRAAIDSLTRTWNRDAIFELLRLELARAARSGSGIALVLADLDHFKSVNDSHGHQAGDEVLRAAADRMRGAVRPYDAIGRYGGEEFMILLPDCDRPTSRRISERIRARVAELPVDTPRGPIPITTSLGVAEQLRDVRDDPEAFVAAADAALYRAKANGRNRVEYAE